MLLGTLAMLLAGCTGPDALQVASVNGDAISYSTYQHIVDLYKDQSASQGQPVDWQTPQGRGGLASAQASALQYLTSALLLHQQVVRQHLRVTQKDLQTQVTSLIRSVKNAEQQNPDDAQFRALVAASGTALKTIPQDPGMPALIAGQTSYADTLLILGHEAADVQALQVAGKAPTAHVRVIETTTQRQAQELEAQLQHGADFATLAKLHSLDQSSAQAGGDLGQPYFYVGQLASLSQPLDAAIFGVHANYSAKTAYVIAPMDASQGSKYLLAEVTQRSTGAIAKISDQQTQTTVLSAWLSLKLQPSANYQQYVAVDPTPTTGGLGG
jgi:hypothetical protein